MFDHVKFGVSDYEASKAFFLKALAPLGVVVGSEGSPAYGVELVAKGAASLCLCQADEKPAPLHLAFTAESREQVNAFHRAALAAGGKDNGAPGLRPQYHAHYYAAFVIGPDGHNIEAVCHEPGPAAFVASHARDAVFERGLRSFFEYRDLGIRKATGGRVVAHVIRAAAGQAFSGQPHLHRTAFQLVYVLKGWIEFEYEGQGVVRLEAGSCVHQPPGIRHRELGHSDDIEMLEVVLPGDFTTEEVQSIPAQRQDA